jgi:myxalamid-type polyketide synthase MxaB
MDERRPSRDNSALLRQAFLALQETQAKLRAAEHHASEPVAVIGMGCRFPGGVVNAESFWELLRDGRDAVGKVPADRWDMEAYYDPDPGKPGKISSPYAAFLSQPVDGFDAAFFGIAPREAANMDPQQRLALEVAWETLEHAGMDPTSLHGSRTGIFLGIASRDYSQLAAQSADPARMDGHYALGVSHSVASGRISYILGLEGPSLSIDTACSSSLVSVHLACQSLRNGECNLALAGGVNLMLSPETSALLSRLKMLSPSGCCKAFDAAADGFVRGEGCGFVALKLLSKAQADGDRVLAVVRGSAVNQDGASSSLTAPNGPAQVALIRQALASGGVDPREVSYVEAHGTGTPLGDPIELQSLGAVYGAARAANAPTLLVGSLKTNIGHLEASAGIAGFIKAVLSLHHREIPPHLHLDQPTPHIRWDALRLAVPTQRAAWAVGPGARMASVSSFGYSGTNAHVVIAEAPPVQADHKQIEWPVQPLAFSAKSATALRQIADEYRRFLEQNSSADLRDVCYTANAGRAHFAHRACLLAATREEMQQHLAALAESGEGKVVHEAPRVAFLFTGQGSQYPGMGRDLYANSSTFRAAIARCAAAWKQETGESLIEILYPETGEANHLEEARYAQPALFAFEFALSELWRSWGIEPSVVLGHSLGEYVAAVAAGIFSVEDGMKLVCARARLMDTLTAPGAMRAVIASIETVRHAMSGEQGAVDIAVVNGPQAVVISGAADAVERVAAKLESQGVRTQKLSVTHAFHSPLLEPILDEFEQCAAAVQFHPPRIRIVANLTGAMAQAGEMSTPRYWRQHMRHAVQFDAGLRAVLATGCNAVLEIGPQPHLLALGKTAHSGETIEWLPSVRRGRNVWTDMLSSLQTFYGLGAKIRWKSVHENSGSPITLPTYPFEREPYWFTKKPVVNAEPSLLMSQGHPLLGARLPSPMQQIQFQSKIAAAQPAYLADHAVAGQCILPAAAYLEMALCAGQEATGSPVSIQSATLLQACVLDTPRILQCVLEPQNATHAFSIYSRAQADATGDWTLHATGEVQSTAACPAVNAPVSLHELRQHCARELSAAEFYENFSANNVQFGPMFRGITRLWNGPGEALVEFSIPQSIQAEQPQYQVHPVVLDACLQSAVALLAAVDCTTIYLPAALESLEISGDPSRLAVAHAQVRSDTEVRPGESFTSDIRGFDKDGNAILAIKGFVMRPLRQETRLASPASSFEDLQEIEWVPLAEDAVPGASLPPAVVLCGDAESTASFAAVLDPIGVLVQGTVSILDGGGSLEAQLQKIQRESTTPLEDVLFLAPSAPPELEISSADAWMNWEKKSLGACVALSQALLRLETQAPVRMWVVTRGARSSDMRELSSAMLTGFARALVLEHPEMPVVRLDMDSKDVSADNLLRCLRAAANKNELMLRGNTIYEPRLHAVPSAPKSDRENIRVELILPGTLEGLELVAAERHGPGPGELEIQVKAAGLNFRDVLNTLGMYKGKTGPLGGECAGIVTHIGSGVTEFQAGDAVVALAQGCFANFVVARDSLVWKKPDSLEFSDAVTVPIAFLTAWYALKTIADLRPGERVLIHAGAGGVGLAAIQVAHRCGATVFATAGSEEKRDYLRSIGVAHVMDSRSASFAEEIQIATGGCGVDVVLNSLTGPLVDAGIVSLAPGGRFIELGLADVRSPESVAEQRPDISYHTVNLVPALESGEGFLREILDEVFSCMAAGELQPLPQTTFPLHDARDAFRYMAQARHIGRVVLCPQSIAPTASIRKDGAYLVTGGLSGLGLEVLQWLARSGAGQIIVMGRSAASAEAQKIFESLQDSGIVVSVCRGDVTLESDVARVIAQAEDIPLRGVFHCAGTLEDRALLRQDWESFAHVLAPKLSGAWNLHRATEGRPLNHFVMFSSVASVFGSPGQTNYAAANAFLDGLAQYRRNHGLPALSINWGAWAKTGMAARQPAESKSGLRPMPVNEALQMLETAMQAGPAQVIAARIDWNAAARNIMPSLLRKMQRAVPAPSAKTVADTKQSWLPKLQVAPTTQRALLLRQMLQQQVRQVLGLSASYSINPVQPLQELGLDSLLSIELRNALSANLERNLPATLLFNFPSLHALEEYLAGLLLAVEISSAEEKRQQSRNGNHSAALLEKIESLSDEEVDRMLAAKATGGIQ